MAKNNPGNDSTDQEEEREGESSVTPLGAPTNEKPGGVADELGGEAEIDETSSDVTDTED